MRLAAHILCYNVSQFLPHVLANVGPHVDRVYLALPERPWTYNAAQRERERNPTTRAEIDAMACAAPVEVIEGDWATETEMRNACLYRARAEGFDWLLTQDADEFYSDPSWALIHDYLRGNPDTDCVVTTWYHFWKSSDLVLQARDGSLLSNNANFAMRCDSDAVFARMRLPSVDRPAVLDARCHHYSYVLDDAQMHAKIATWGHAGEFDAERWLRLKWQYWRPSTRNLHPIVPAAWRAAIRFDEPLPSFAAPFLRDVATAPPAPLRVRIDELAYDLSAQLRYRTREGRRAIRRMIR